MKDKKDKEETNKNKKVKKKSGNIKGDPTAECY
jgi:hypothetical protein